MVQESRENTFIDIRKIGRNLIEMMKNSLKADLEEESKLPKELQDKVNEIDGREKAMRIGGKEINVKLEGKKASINNKLSFAKEKSQRVKRVEMRKNSALGEKTYEER